MSVLDEINNAVGRESNGYMHILLIEGFAGGSTPAEHRIEVLSFSWGISDSGSASRSQSAKVAMQDVHFLCPVSEASPLLKRAFTSGTRLDKAVLTARRPGAPDNVLKVTMEDILITSYQSNGRDGADRLVDELALSSEHVDIEYRREKPDGSLEAPVHTGWDLTESKI